MAWISYPLVCGCKAYEYKTHAYLIKGRRCCLIPKSEGHSNSDCTSYNERWSKFLETVTTIAAFVNLIVTCSYLNGADGSDCGGDGPGNGGGSDGDNQMGWYGSVANTNSTK